MNTFKSLFHYDTDKSLMVGIERECFLVQNGSISPIAPMALSTLPQNEHFGYELSACQLEERVGPCQLIDIPAALAANEAHIRRAESLIGFERRYCEVASDDMPLDIFPDPTGRYQQITTNMPKHVLLAACQVAATHVHIGMPDHDTALIVYNQVIKHLDCLCTMGNNSRGRRLNIYKEMAPDYLPTTYASCHEFYQEAVAKGFIHDPRKCWHLIRLSIHGTIEFRMFGTTSDLNRIMAWAGYCREICFHAMSV